VPVGVVAGEPGHLEAEHYPHPAHADFRDEATEAFAVGRRRARLALVTVDHHDLIDGPAQGDRPLAQRVLTGSRLGVLHHLAKRALAHIEVGRARQVCRADLVGGFDAHRSDSVTCKRHRDEHSHHGSGVAVWACWGCRSGGCGDAASGSHPRRDALA